MRGTLCLLSSNCVSVNKQVKNRISLHSKVKPSMKAKKGYL